MLFDSILQTVKDNDNPDYVEKFGPFLSKSEYSWLGVGYYFWERFLKIAHWWGESHCKGSYMICKAHAEFNDDEVLDLAGNTEQMEYFRKTCEALEKEYPQQRITISYVIHYLKDKKIFAYKVIRAHSINCGEGDVYYRRNFTEKFPNSYLNLMPAIQLCVVDKSCVKDYSIIYPDTYVYVV